MPFQPTYNVPEDRRPYWLPADSPVGCLMLHGFIGSPKSTRPLSTYLQAHGISCLCPLLPGHGQFPNKLHGVKSSQWLAEVEEALERLRRHADEIFIISHSMGSALGAHLVTTRGNIQGMVMLAPAYELPDTRLRFAWLLRYIIPWLSPLKRGSMRRVAIERLHDFDPTIDVDDPHLQGWLQEISRFPMDALDEMRKTFYMGRKLWPRVEPPTLILQGGHDIATTPEHSRALHAELPGDNNELVIFEDAGHELMRPFSPFAPETWRRIYDFLQAHSETVLPEPAPFPEFGGDA